MSIFDKTLTMTLAVVAVVAIVLLLQMVFAPNKTALPELALEIPPP
jgi:hypothetical protein